MNMSTGVVTIRLCFPFLQQLIHSNYVTVMVTTADDRLIEKVVDLT
jgi:hypothetical protein